MHLLVSDAEHAHSGTQLASVAAVVVVVFSDASQIGELERDASASKSETLPVIFLDHCR